VDKIVVLPLSIDTDLYDPAITKPFVYSSSANDPILGGVWVVGRDAGPPEELAPAFRFLSVFKMEERKGGDLLLEAYWNEFLGVEDVLLTIHTYVYAHRNPRDLQALTDIIRDHAIMLVYAIWIFELLK
jgi:hypothetical protein